MTGHHSLLSIGLIGCDRGYVGVTTRCGGLVNLPAVSVAIATRLGMLWLEMLMCAGALLVLDQVQMRGETECP